MITLCIITKNNEKTIEQCIKSVIKIVSEIVVVDSASSDKTREIAEKLGARVFDFIWKDNFSEAKNYAKDKAKEKWILNLDADETISDKDIERLSELARKDEYIGYYLIQRNYTNSSGEFCWTSCTDDIYEESKTALGFVPRKMVRLFKNDPRIFFEGAVHDSVIPSIMKIGLGLIGETDVPIHHYGLINRGIERTEWYIDLEKKNIRHDFFQEYQIASQLHSIGRLKEASEHLLESLRLNEDFHLSWLELAIIFIKNNKIIEAKPLLLRSLELQEHEMTWSHLGIVAVYEKKFDDAEKFFRMAISLNPKNSDFYFNLGQVLSQLKKFEKAKEAFQKASYLNPSYKDRIKNILTD